MKIWSCKYFDAHEAGVFVFPCGLMKMRDYVVQNKFKSSMMSSKSERHGVTMRDDGQF